jgi:hypothetical protein
MDIHEITLNDMRMFTATGYQKGGTILRLGSPQFALLILASGMPSCFFMALVYAILISVHSPFMPYLPWGKVKG